MKLPFFRPALLGGLLLTLTIPAVQAQTVTSGPDSVLVRRAGTAATDTSNAPVRRKPGAPLTRPAKAALWALLPSGGQVYNHDYWKVPLVLAGIGAAGYSVYWNNGRYQQFRREAARRAAGGTRETDPSKITQGFSDAALPRGSAFYRRNRDLSVVVTAAIYGLSIMEALVDAHLSTFTISDDLTLRVAPTVLPLAGTYVVVPAVGLTLTRR